MTRFKSVAGLRFVGLLLTSALMSQTAIGASHCKGLAETACAGDNGCRWVSGYVRKDGREVAAHCRLGSPTKASTDTKTGSPKISAVK